MTLWKCSCGVPPFYSNGAMVCLCTYDQQIAEGEKGIQAMVQVVDVFKKTRDIMAKIAGAAVKYEQSEDSRKGPVGGGREPQDV